MSYTIEQLDEAIEKHFTNEGDAWFELREEGSRSYDSVPGVNPDGSPKMEKTAYGDWKYRVYDHVERTTPGQGVEIPGIGYARVLDSHGGEGQGDQYWFVFKVIDLDGNARIFERNGWYASYDGGHYEGPTVEVSPVEKTVTVWKAVK